jgi:bifunctional DNA-binding transcriptional regulator/antitoxin component of YhaV-PrlF toxin-antitoxin module
MEVKNTEFICHLDGLSKLSIPLEVRKEAGFAESELVEICATEEGILIKKYEPPIEVNKEKIGKMVGSIVRIGCDACPFLDMDNPPCRGQKRDCGSILIEWLTK